ncbi:MAG: O-antigen ligase family protein, partial [Chloroflexi bacterium]|nr:O-antigen ligase family protein [Chloroflexota bacterium]
SGNLSLLVDQLAAASTEINSALWPGFYPASPDAADFSGLWEFSELGADIVENGDSTVEVDFHGDSLGLALRRDNYRAYLYVSVNDEPSAILPEEYNDNDDLGLNGSYLVLTSADYRPQIVTEAIAQGLPSAEVNTAQIQAARGWDQWALIGFVVGQRQPIGATNLFVITFSLMALGLLAVAIREGREVKWPSLLAPAEWIQARLSEGLHLVLSIAAALAVWLGAAITWGGLLPDLLRRLGDGPTLLITTLTAGVVYFSPWLILTLVALLLLFVLIYTRPAVGLALIILFAPFYLWPRPLFDRAFSMVEIISLLTLAAWAIHIIAQRKEIGWPSLRSLWASLTGLDKAVGLFVLISFVSLSWAELLGVAVTELRQTIVEPLVLYLALRTLPLSKEERWRIVDLLMLTGTIVALIGLYQIAAGVGLITAEGGSLRIRSIYNSPNSAGLFLGRLVPLAAAIAVLASPGRRRWLYAGAGLLIAIATVLTFSRGAILLGVPAGLGLVTIVWLGRTGLLIVLGGVVALLLALIPLSQLPRFSELFDPTTGSTFLRLQLWQSSAQLLADHPITGVGLDQFLYEYRGSYILPAAWEQPDLSHPHNFLLNYWARLGLVGLAAGVWMQIAFWRMAQASQQRLKGLDQDSYALVIGLMASMAALIGHGLVDEPHFAIDLALLFSLPLGLLAQIDAHPEGETHDESDNP